MALALHGATSAGTNIEDFDYDRADIGGAIKSAMQGVTFEGVTVSEIHLTRSASILEVPVLQYSTIRPNTNILLFSILFTGSSVFPS